MDSILEKHLKKIFIQPNIVATKEVPKTRTNIKKHVHKDLTESDPILEKHLAKIFIEESISNEIKQAVEVKKKNEEILNIFTNIIEKKITEPVLNSVDELTQFDSIIDVPEQPKIIEEFVDKNNVIQVPEKEKDLKPSIIDAYKTAIQPLPTTLEPEIKYSDPVEIDDSVARLDEPTSQDVYVQSIKNTENEPKISEIQSSDDEFFKFLERNRDNPRIKNFFNSHSESMKKEILKLTENFTREKMLIASESGGGSGNVTINNSTVQGGKKIVQIIGDGSNIEYIVKHDLDSKDIVISVFDNFTEELVICDAINLNLNETKFKFSKPLSVNSIRIIIMS
jgi:hypothetical protein